MVLIPDRYSRNSSSKSDVTRAGTVKGREMCHLSLFVCQHCHPSWHTPIQMTVFAFMCAQTGDEMIILVISIQAVIFPVFHDDGTNVAANLITPHRHSNSLLARFFSPLPHGADFTEIKWNAAQSTGCTDVRKTHWTQKIRLPDWRHRFKLQIQHAWKI